MKLKETLELKLGHWSQRCDSQKFGVARAAGSEGRGAASKQFHLDGTNISTSTHSSSCCPHISAAREQPLRWQSPSNMDATYAPRRSETAMRGAAYFTSPTTSIFM